MDRHPTAASRRSVSVWRRAAAALYDGLALLAIWFVVAAIAVGLHHGEAVPPDGEFALRLALGVAAWAYFAGCWRRGGQTLGMKTWRIRVVARATGAALSWRQASVRFVVGALHWLVFVVAVWALWATPVARGLTFGAGTVLIGGYWWLLGGRGDALIDRTAGSQLEFRD